MRGQKIKSGLLIVLFVGLLLVEAILLLRSPDNPARSTDFLGYWSSSRLLLRGNKLYDQDALLAIQRQEGWASPEPMVSWNPPHLHLILLPLAALPFDLAATTWFILTPVLMGTAILLIWFALPSHETNRAPLLALLAGFGFSRVWHAILEGQVNILVFLSLATFIFLTAKKKDWQAGAFLAVTTIKPHLVYLLLPLLLVDLIRLRRWHLLLGFSLTMVVLLSLVTAFDPEWPITYGSLLANSFHSPWNHPYPTPTFHGVALTYAGTGLARNLWMFILPLTVCMSLRRRKPDFITTTCWALLIGLPTSPFGWSTDQILLLLPILQICAWAVTMNTRHKVSIAFSLILLYLYALGIWLIHYQEPLFLAVPIGTGVLFWATATHSKTNSRD